MSKKNYDRITQWDHIPIFNRVRGHFDGVHFDFVSELLGEGGLGGPTTKNWK